MAFNLPRGTYDLYGNDKELFDNIRDFGFGLAALFNFTKMQVPTFEESELYHRSVGESSDIVTKETFDLEAKGGTNYTLRPEFTAGIVRSFISNKLYANPDLPCKFSYAGPVFRYERPQKGRYREFNQFGVESLGVSSYKHDLEVIQLGYEYLIGLGFKDVIIKINYLGNENSREAYRQALKEYFRPILPNMCGDCQVRFEKNPLRMLDCKSPTDQEYVKNAPKISDYYEPEDEIKFHQILGGLDNVEIPYTIDDSLVRGLDYYSEIVFEYYLAGHEDLGAIGAGGHYEALIHELGGPELSGVGFSFGLERVYTLFNELKIDNDDIQASNSLDIYICEMVENPERIKEHDSLLLYLRTSGFKVEMNYSKKNLSSLLKIAGRMKAKFALILAEAEDERDACLIKDLNKFEQVEVKYEALVDYFDEHLAIASNIEEE